MRSCEYSETPGEADKLTGVVRLQDVVFKRFNRTMRHDEPYLHLADIVHVQFSTQKNGDKEDVVTQHNNWDATLNPVLAWAKIVRRVWEIPGAKEDWTVDRYVDSDGKIYRMLGKAVEGTLQGISDR